jgi:hypothetical protein
MSDLQYLKWFMGCLSVCAVSSAVPAFAQIEDTFGGNPGTNAFIRIPSDTDDWTRHFRLGAMVGLNIKASFSMKGNFGVSGNNPAAGVFDDGYVKKDQSGDTAYTSNWGYNNASQLSGNDLTMHSSSSFSTEGSSSTDGGLQAGLDLAYGGNLWYWKHARVGWEMGFGWLPIEISQNQSLNANVNQSTYVFDTTGILVPSAPYQGDPGGNSALIPIGYSSSTTNSTTGSVNGKHTMDVSLFTLRLGPSIYWDVSQRVGFSVGAGPAVGLVSGDYKYDETIIANGVSAHNSGKISGSDFVYGGYVNATVMYHLVNNGDIYLGAQFMPMSDAKISGGGREGTLDLSGQVYISVGINWPF